MKKIIAVIAAIGTLLAALIGAVAILNNRDNKISDKTAA